MNRRATTWVVLAVAAGLGGCYADKPPRISLDPMTARTAPAAVIFFADGIEPDTFDQLLRAGQLPNIKRHLIDGGVRVDRAAASLPTITYANAVSFVTGLLPGHHGITGNRWFDRRELVFQDYTTISSYRDVDNDFATPTIYEMLSGEFTATITIPVRRGATRSWDNWASAGAAWYFRRYDIVDQLGVYRLDEIGREANKRGRWPRLIFTYFPSPDTVGHKYGPRSDEYRDILLDLDKRIGQFCQSLIDAGLYDSTYRILVTDHGFVSTSPQNLINLTDFLNTRLRISATDEAYGHDGTRQAREKHFAGSRTVVVVDGKRCCNLHLRVDRDWATPPSAMLIDQFAQLCSPVESMDEDLRRMVQGQSFPELLAGLDGIDLVAVRQGDGIVRVVSRVGQARIARQASAAGKMYRYEVIAGMDPLGYSTAPTTRSLVDGRYHPSRVWLETTAHTSRPDLVAQLPELFDSPRAGEIVLFAMEGWSFGEHAELGGHGGVTAREILVPFVIAGPGIRPGAVIPAARTVDLAPTVLGLLGMSDRYSPTSPSDGIDLSGQLLERQGVVPAP